MQLADVDSHPSAEGWTPILVDTPGSSAPLLPATDESVPQLPLPGPMRPDPNSR